MEYNIIDPLRLPSDLKEKYQIFKELGHGAYGVVHKKWGTKIRTGKQWRTQVWGRGAAERKVPPKTRKVLPQTPLGAPSPDPAGVQPQTPLGFRPKSRR